MLLTNEINYYDFGEFRLDVIHRQLLRNGVSIALTHKAYLTLLILVRNAGRIVEKEEIISEIWTDSFVEESNLSQYIYVLRKILGNDERDNPYIETITKRGFRFISPVKEVNADIHISNDVLSSEIINDKTFQVEENSSDVFFDEVSFSPDKDTLQNKITEIVESPENYSLTSQQLSSSNRLWLSLITLVFLALGLISITFYFYSSPKNESRNAASPVKSIAVLPFKQIGEENSNDKLGLGMADSIIIHLSKIKLIPVRPTSAIFQFADKPDVNSVDAGKRLDVDAVLEGTIQRENERVRVSVKLIDVKNGDVFWAQNYNENFTNIIALQDSISDTVTKSLSQKLTDPAPNIISSTTNTEAYQAYLLGLYFGNTRTKEGLEKGVENFQKAVDLDPNYARAYAMLADSYNMLGYYEYEDPQEMLKKGRIAAEKALSLDDTVSEAHLAMAFIEKREKKNLTLARQELERAISLNPYSSVARVRYGWGFLSAGNMEEAVKQMRLAQEYDPLSPVSNNALCDVLMTRRSFGEAINYCQKAVDISPKQTLNHIRLAEAYFFSGRQQEAISQLQNHINSLSGEDESYALGLLSYFYAKENHRAEAEKIVTDLKEKVNESPSLYEYLIPVTYALGNDKESLEYLQKFRKVQFSDNLFRSRFALMWEDVRADKRFTL